MQRVSGQKIIYQFMMSADGTGAHEAIEGEPLTLCSWDNVGNLPSVELGSGQPHGPCTIHHHRLEVICFVECSIPMWIRANDDL